MAFFGLKLVCLAKSPFKEATLPTAAGFPHSEPEELCFSLSGGDERAPTKIQPSLPPALQSAWLQLPRRVWSSLCRRIKGVSKIQMSSALTRKKYRTKIMSTTQEIFHILHKLVLHESSNPSLAGGIQSPEKKTLVEPEHEVLNNLELLYLSNNSKHLYIALEYLKNIVEPLKVLAALKGSLALASNGHATNSADAEVLPMDYDLNSTVNLFEGLITKEFLCAFQQHKVMVSGLESRNLKLLKKLRSVKALRKNLKKVCGVAYVVAAIGSVVLTVMGSVVGSSATNAAINALSFTEKLVDSLLARREEAFEGEHKTITKILNLFVIKERDIFQVIVKKLMEDTCFLSTTNMKAIPNTVDKDTKTNSFDSLVNLVDFCIGEMVTMMAEFLKIIGANDI